MFKDILEIIKCPECGEKFSLEEEVLDGEEILEGKLCCSNFHHWIIKDGIINFGSQEQELANNWGELYEENNYEELDEKIKAATANNLLEGYDKAKSRLIEIIINTNPETILDIATGRGMLLTELIKYLKESTKLICVDLSYDVLKYDRLKVKKLRPKLKINFIACNAAKLPFEDKVVDLSTSFIGIQNMMDVMLEGIKEANRVSKKGLVNVGIVVSNSSNKLEGCKEPLKQYEIYKPETFLTIGGFMKTHERGCHNNTSIELVYEDTGKENKTDLIPFEGEWFGVVIVSCN